MEDITLYIIPLVQWRILPSILFLSYNGGYYPLYYSSHTMEDITLYIILLIQWRILPSILFFSYNGGYYPLYQPLIHCRVYQPLPPLILEHFFKLRLTGDLAGGTSVLYRFCSLIHDLFFFSTVSLDLAKRYSISFGLAHKAMSAMIKRIIIYRLVSGT